jgi:endonuclease G, mitochondrial
LRIARNPRWVIEKLTAENIRGEAVRNTLFREDTSIPAHLRARLGAYVGSGLDRGHLAAAANHRNNSAAMNDTFLLSNISPQVGVGFNRDYMSRMEAWLRGLTASHDVYVATGPLWVPTTSATPANPAVATEFATTGTQWQRTQWQHSHATLGSPLQWISVPSHFFKVVLAVRKTSDTAAADASALVAAFVLPNAPINANKPLTDFIVPLLSVEALSGLQVSVLRCLSRM